jgi:NAD(P)-dependent dehydrogenase (short-subunit alcohol dehydrogenase family)
MYARTNAYLKRWYADIGARVRKGQLLAEIETPELDQYSTAVAALSELRNRTLRHARPGSRRGRPKIFCSKTALGPGEPADIADAIAFLASNEGRWITGKVPECDGRLAF